MRWPSLPTFPVLIQENGLSMVLWSVLTLPTVYSRGKESYEEEREIKKDEMEWGKKKDETKKGERKN